MQANQNPQNRQQQQQQQRIRRATSCSFQNSKHGESPLTFQILVDHLTAAVCSSVNIFFGRVSSSLIPASDSLVAMVTMNIGETLCQSHAASRSNDYFLLSQRRLVSHDSLCVTSCVVVVQHVACEVVTSSVLTGSSKTMTSSSEVKTAVHLCDVGCG
ncbi:hypothetical protein ABVT39_009927 [Epinephelus coioides]